jgi:hypothetical protein
MKMVEQHFMMKPGISSPTDFEGIDGFVDICIRNGRDTNSAECERKGKSKGQQLL